MPERGWRQLALIALAWALVSCAPMARSPQRPAYIDHWYAQAAPPSPIGTIGAMLRPDQARNAVIVQIAEGAGPDEVVVLDADTGTVAGRLRAIERKTADGMQLVHYQVVEWGEPDSFLRIGAPVYPAP